MWKYNVKDFDPAAPVIEVQVDFGEVAGGTTFMQIDSGADMSCIPKEIVPPSKDLPYGYSYIVGYDGVKVPRKTYYVSIRIAGRIFEDIEALPIEGEMGLVGRDVLNSLRLTLDGPKLQIFINGD